MDEERPEGDGGLSDPVLLRVLTLPAGQSGSDAVGAFSQGPIQ